ncbi:hypothetical protein B1A99_19285 [Cohnella sp. CIP 111063]|nr:hypothetical protein B1A99_19285 [Cohnella sp. CIP 111063]
MIEAPLSIYFLYKFDIIRVYNKLGWESITSRAEVILMQFSLTEVIMLGMFLLTLLTFTNKRK